MYRLDEVRVGDRWISPSGKRFKVVHVDYFDDEDEAEPRRIMLNFSEPGTAFAGPPHHLVPLAPRLQLVLGGKSHRVVNRGRT